jgi:flagellar biosynthetic protein FliR
MASSPLSAWVISLLLVSLRVAPVFALAPPFSLIRVPAQFRMLFGLGLSAGLVGAHPVTALVTDLQTGNLLVLALRELAVGATFVLAFQVMFAALYVAGRTIDIQAGFGLAVLVDPASQNQTPLVGSLFAYAAGAVFFALNGHLDLLRLLAASLDAVPLGTGGPPTSLTHLTQFISVVFVTSFGVAGGLILCLFLADLAIALMSRTVPQMNVLVLGFQVKTILLLVVLPVTFGVAGALFVRLTRLTLEAIPGLL